MSLAQELWHANADLAQACLEHPFVQGLADGSLPRPAFAYFIGQDAFFLDAFARAYCIAAARAPDLSGLRAFHELAGGVINELGLHEHYAAQWELDIRQVTPGVTTRRYTDFLLATAWRYDAGMTAAAMAPCMRLYAFIGAELAKRGKTEHHYTHWITTYSDPAFQDLAGRIEELVDRYASDAPETRAAYRYAMLCERDFFQAAWEERAA